MMGIFSASHEDRFHRTPEEDSVQILGQERGGICQMRFKRRSIREVSDAEM